MEAVVAYLWYRLGICLEGLSETTTSIRKLIRLKLEASGCLIQV
jgi:hypothetical protein